MSNSHENYQSAIDKAGVHINRQHEIANGMNTLHDAMSEGRALEIARLVKVREVVDSVFSKDELHVVALNHEAEIKEAKRQEAISERRKLQDDKYPVAVLHDAARRFDYTSDEISSGERAAKLKREQVEQSHGDKLSSGTLSGGYFNGHLHMAVERAQKAEEQHQES